MSEVAFFFFFFFFLGGGGGGWGAGRGLAYLMRGMVKALMP